MEAWGEVQHSGQKESGIVSSSVLHEDLLSNLTLQGLVAGNTHSLCLMMLKTWGVSPLS